MHIILKNLVKMICFGI